MDLKQIEKLMAAMESARMRRVVLKKEGFEIELERECAVNFQSNVQSGIPSNVQMVPPIWKEGPSEVSSLSSASKESTNKLTSVGRFVTSPMVGTFYPAPSPENPPYVKVGDEVDEDTVVCIIEAMKVMNEIKSGVRGKVSEVLLQAGDPVEFGTKLFRIE